MAFSMSSDSQATVSSLVINANLPMNGYDIEFTTGGMVYTDIPFKDYKCGVCAKVFKENDTVFLKIRAIKKTKDGPVCLSVPVHITCTTGKIKWTLSQENPKFKDGGK